MEANPESYLSQAEASDDPDEAMGYLAVAVRAINREAKDNPDRLQELVPELCKAVESVAELKAKKDSPRELPANDKTYDVEWIVRGPVRLLAIPVAAVIAAVAIGRVISIDGVRQRVLARSERTYRSPKRVKRAIW